MSSISVNLLLITVAVNLLLQFTAGQIGANEGERQVCMDNAGDREVTGASKTRRLDCTVNCEYSDGNTEPYNSPNGQPCCDMVGGLPTGLCSNGACPVGLGRYGGIIT